MSELLLAEEQIVRTVSDDELAAAVPSQELAALRRRYPSGAGEFLVKQNGEVFFQPTSGTQAVPVPEIDSRVAGSPPPPKHALDVSI
jgi:hypothetical protein